MMSTRHLAQCVELAQIPPYFVQFALSVHAKVCSRKFRSRSQLQHVEVQKCALN